MAFSSINLREFLKLANLSSWSSSSSRKSPGLTKMRLFWFTIPLKLQSRFMERAIMTTSIFQRRISTWKIRVSPCIRTNTSRLSTRALYLLSSRGAHLQLKEKNEIRSRGWLTSLLKKKRKNGWFWKRAILMNLKLKVSTVMTPMTRMSWTGGKNVLSRKPSQLSLESTRVSAKQLKKMKCCSKTRSSQLNHFKAKSGQIPKSRAVWLSSPKAHSTTPALLSQT